MDNIKKLDKNEEYEIYDLLLNCADCLKVLKSLDNETNHNVIPGIKIFLNFLEKDIEKCQGLLKIWFFCSGRANCKSNDVCEERADVITFTLVSILTSISHL